jgi:NADP-dependent 3-hydroxy acid dehydrogenase YdfG
MMDLDGRVAIVTGASAGIGEAVARELVADGASVVVNARRGDRLETLKAELDKAQGVECVAAVAGDCSDDAVIAAMFDAAESAFGKPADLVVVNAGRGLAGSVVSSDKAEWDEVVRTNLLGAASLMRASAERMTADRETVSSGSGWTDQPRDIVVLGSVVGRHVSPFSSMYGSTKFAVHSLAEALRREIGPKGVRVTLVEPAVVVSEFQQVAGYTDELVEGFEEKFGPLLVPGDIARSIAFVAGQPAHVHVSDIVVRATRQEYP